MDHTVQDRIQNLAKKNKKHIFFKYRISKDLNKKRIQEYECDCCRQYFGVNRNVREDPDKES